MPGWEDPPNPVSETSDPSQMTSKGELALTAALFLAPCGVILERCMADGSLFALHPALNALAMLVCLPSEAGEQHLTSPHSWAALVTAMFFSLNVFQGLLLTFEGKQANWQWKDETHVLTGVLVYIGAVATMLYGLHTSAWGAQMFAPDRQFQLTVLILAAHVTLVGKSLVLQRRPPVAQQKKVA
ncbi:hypothetical protein BBJ28_00018841 [Nothophytophthora sp. Chile5]|nr:hypothetical protein BBJ28_00018841 [Nothophytophthora sp. Chile5]